MIGMVFVKTRSWKRSHSRVRRAIDSSLRRMGSSERMIEASERFGARRPVETLRQLMRVSEVLRTAGRELERVSRGLPLAPPFLFLETMAQLVCATGRLAELSERADQSRAWLVDAVLSGAVPVDPFDPALEALRLAAEPQPVPATPLLDLMEPDSGFRQFFIRRRRFVPAALADAPRRISRGRAPPVL